MKKILVILLVVIMTLSVIPASYAEEEIEELTRAEALAAMLMTFDLYNYAQETNYSEVFTDVPEDYWAAGLILYAYNLGITKGTSVDTFEPELIITKEEFLTFLMRFTYNDPEISPDNLFDIEMTQYAIDVDSFDEMTIADILENFEWIAAAGVELVDNSYKNNIVQVGEFLIIPRVEGEEYKEVTISDESILQYKGARSDAYIFRAVEAGNATVSMPDDLIYDFIILESGKGEGTFILSKDVINEIPLGCMASITLESNPSTGYSWDMLPNDNVELINNVYNHYVIEVEESVPGTGGEQILTFLMTGVGETELVVKYGRSWESDEEDVPTAVFDIVITDGNANVSADIGTELDNYENDAIDGSKYTFPPYYYFTTLVQSGETLHIPLENSYTYELDISDESLLKEKDVSSEDYYVFDTLGTGRVTILLGISDLDGNLTENRVYEIFIVKNIEEMYPLNEDEINEIPVEAIVTLSFHANASTGYSWKMLPNDNVELIYKNYYHYPVEEGLVGTGGLETLTFLMKVPGETELVLKYSLTAEPENEDTWEHRYQIIITE
jgi:Predicted secreted protein